MCKRNSYSLISFTFAFVLLGACVGGLPAITQDRTAEIGAGGYIRISPRGAQPTPIALAVVGAEVDRESASVAFTLTDGSAVSATLATDYPPEWAIGCPTNVTATKMEVLRFEEEALTLDDVTFDQPMLIANCPAPPAIFVLREAAGGNPDYTAFACDWWAGAKCIFFGRDYVTLHGSIVAAGTDELIPEAEAVFALPWGAKTVPGDFEITLPGNSVIEFTASAPGYAPSASTIEVYLLKTGNRTEQQVFVTNPKKPGDEFKTGEKLEFVDPDTPIEFRWELQREP